MSNNDKRPIKSLGQRASLVPQSSIPKLKCTPNGKAARASIATSSPSKSTYAQKTQSSNSRITNALSEESNISVYVRCRSRNDREIKENSGVVVSTMGHNAKEVVLQTGPMAVSNKTYTFDKVFGAESDQEMVYDGIAKGVLEEMLQGYNCTVFAYGQTGTGKTYTMSGDIQMSGNRLSENAGIIPRTLVDLFRSLEKKSEFSVKVSFIELYNEELKDLLLTNESEERKVRIYEDPNKKSIVVQGMEEIFIKSAAEGMKVLSQGSYNRQVAATKCNDISSRSHSVFTITVHIKEIDPISGEEYLKIGKLNLVDLAGSENINRSGAENKRAREAGMINQSLLTLGRVINALVDQSPHIPYRESKLTRLLQDSLGGQTKTCIIATVSPAKVSLDETVSTLEYANRAKSIKNKPQVNQSMSKKMLIREYVEEIERLRNDLNATRNRNGIYVTEENMEKITAESESRRILVEEQKLRINVLEEQLRKLKVDFEGQLERLSGLEDNINNLQEERNVLSRELEQIKDNLYRTSCELKLEKYVSEDREEVSNKLSTLYRQLAETLNDVVCSRDELHVVIEKRQQINNDNKVILDDSKSSVLCQTRTIAGDVSRLARDNFVFGEDLTHNFEAMARSQQQKITKRCTDINTVSEDIGIKIQTAVTDIFERSKGMNNSIDGIEAVKAEVTEAIVHNLDALRASTSTATNQILKSVSCTETELKDALTSHQKDIAETFTAVQNQIGAQTDEIVTLSKQLLEYQKKCMSQLSEEAAKIKEFEVMEATRSNSEKQKLLEVISSAISEHETERLARLSSLLQGTSSSASSIANKQINSGKKFDAFVRDSWVNSQQSFKHDLSQKTTSMVRNIDQLKDSAIVEKLGGISNSMTDFGASHNDAIAKSTASLRSKMVTLSDFTASLKSLNEENHNFTTSQLGEATLRIKQSLASISDALESLGRGIVETKPQLVDTHVQKQRQFIKSFADATSVNINNLEDFVSNVSYNEDKSTPPERQQIVIETDLPHALSREEIMRIHNLDINLREGVTEDIMTPPAQDKGVKRPLAEITSNINVPAQGSEKKAKSRPTTTGSLGNAH